MHTAREDRATDAGAVLAGMGSRVRSLRGGLGMTRRELAVSSGVSERYVAEVELGRGNVSVLILRQLARALQVSPALLLSAPRSRGGRSQGLVAADRAGTHCGFAALAAAAGE